ncbi:hypothetical protein MUCCIDRAFT_92743 [Mucor lusitanicus CBS 277.49]|uniref:protein-serine/threonine phosphatase n=1 Tax=Mucor lusitanicus CBS 277.49 TaxID=747725 RepID=A0A168I239_MUCCL|nr:hypothetical protein MUCCIDRAFT_92743 [Mucor lusitanicus CBS 277.49]
MDLSSMLNGSMPSKKRDYSMSNPNYHSQEMSQPKRLQQPNGSTTTSATPPPAPLPTSTHPRPTATATAAAVVVHPHPKEKSMVYQLSTSLQYVVAKDAIANPQAANHLALVSQRSANYKSSNGVFSSPFRPETDNNLRINVTPSSSNGTNCLYLNPSLNANPGLWSPKLSLKYVMQDQPLTLLPVGRRINGPNGQRSNDDSLECQLRIIEVLIRGDEPKILLEDTYEIQGAYPRGFFVMMAKRQIQHNFVFAFPDHPWFEDLYGLRKSAYVAMRTEDGELYELHLKPSRDKQFLFGYLVKHEAMIHIVKQSMEELLHSRKLPLVLDLDDTLVRIVGEGNERHVPEADIPKCKDRVAVLKDGRRVVLTEGVHEFLEWAQQFFDISVCSLGDQTYVENVVKVLDPQGVCIRGINYSARSEHDYIKRSPDPGRPPKDLLALYSFCALKDKSLGSSFQLPLILDDETRMWPADQIDNIIEVTHQRDSPVWSVSLFPVVRDTLQYVHQEFFRQYDIWIQKCQEAAKYGGVCTRPPPSAVAIYKTYLRHILRDKIASVPASTAPRS